MERSTDLGTRIPDILRRIGSVADRFEMNVFAVGGYIRDLLLNGNGDHRDIDLTVVGDALVLAHQLKQELGAKILVTYKRFETTMMEVSGYKLELVTARQSALRAASAAGRLRRWFEDSVVFELFDCGDPPIP